MIDRLRAPAVLASTLALSACDPAFETIADFCATGQGSPVVIGLNFSDPNNSPYRLTASRESGAYTFYLQDILEAATPATGVTLTQSQLDAMAGLRGFINDRDKFNLGYEEAGGVVTATTNPLDFLESIIARTDPNTIVGAFQAAKNQIARGIASDDAFCSYRNSSIRFVDENAGNKLFAEYSLSYDPFNNTVTQGLVASELQTEISTITNRLEVASFTGGYNMAPSKFEANGFVFPTVRQARLNNSDKTQSMLIDDNTDLNIGIVRISTSNDFCRVKEGEASEGQTVGDVTACPAGTATRLPAKDQCNGVADGSTNETGTNQLRTIDLDATRTGLKRIRLETDYATSEVRVYVSDYVEAIRDSDGTTIIKDPTRCEQQAVLDELAAANQGQGVRLTAVPDTGFDITTVDGGDDIQPIPAFTFTGRTISSRRP